MNKYNKFLMPAIVIILGISFTLGISSFKTDKKMLSPVTMYYHGSSYSQADVQNKSNWNTTPQDCFEGTDKACQVTVDATLIQSGAFKPSVSLSAEPGTSSALTQVKENGIPAPADIVNRD